MSTSASARLGAVPRLALAILLGLAASSCAVGPDFRRPAPPSADDWARASGVSRLEADGTGQIIAAGAVPDPTWWRLFGSPALDDLVASGLKNSPTLAAARATLDQSREQARAGAGMFLPVLSGSAGGERERLAPLRNGVATPPSTFSLYTLTGAVNYELDVFGGLRRNLEALTAAADRQRYAMAGARLALTGNIVDAAIAQAAYAEQARALEDITRLEAAQLDAETTRATAGAGAWSDVMTARQILAADRETLALTRQRREAAGALLTTLLGREATGRAADGPTLAELRVPEAAPLSLPSQIVRLRPDILQAEAALHEASARVGVATAAMFPSVNITGDYGATSLSLGKLGDPQGVFWGVGPTIEAPVFQGGALVHARRAAAAGLRAARANYRATVLSALEQVSDSIDALDADAEVARASRGASDAATQNQAFGEANLRAGVIADLDAMGLRIAADRAALGLAAARAQRLQDVVALYLACGGGWDGHDPDPPSAGSAK